MVSTSQRWVILDIDDVILFMRYDLMTHAGASFEGGWGGRRPPPRKKKKKKKD